MGLIEIIIVLAGVTLLILIIKGLSALFSGSGHRTYKKNFSTKYDSQQEGNTGFDSAPGNKYNKRKHDQDRLNNQRAIDASRKAAQDAQRNFEETRKRNEATRKQVEEITRRTIKRNRDW